MIASDKGGNFKPVPAGGHPAICDMMVDLGMQDGGQYGPKHKVYIRFQIPGERVQGEWEGEKYDRPAVTGIQLTLSLGKNSAMRPFLESWRGKKFTSEEVRGFDITNVAGKPAYLNIVHEEKDGKTYANIASIMPLPHGIQMPQLEGEVIIHDPEAGKDRYDDLPKWLQEKIDGAINDQPSTTTGSGRGAQPVPDGELDDDCPF